MADVGLIDANALMGRIIQRSQGLITPNGEVGYLGLFVKDIQQVVDDTPTINPDDLRGRGRWVWDEHNNEEACSVCKAFAITEYCSGVSFCSNYCPNCGAKMDGKENEND